MNSLVLWWRGWLDGRRPARSLSLSSDHHTTARADVLSRYAHEVFDREYRRARMDSGMVLLSAEKARLRLPDLRELLREASERHDVLEVAGPSVVRRKGEEAVDDGIVSLRRHREHKDRVKAARSEMSRAHEAVVDAEKEIARAAEFERRRMTEAAARAVAYSHFIARLHAVYWGGFRRTYRRSGTVDLRPLPAPQPSWVDRQVPA